MLFAAMGSACLIAWPTAFGAISVAVFVQLRLLCNLFDGMVAVEGGKASPVGALFNEVPDRVADSLLIVALGVAAGIPWLGWLGALLAALTAYIRALGGALGLAQDFRGPMAKQQRMAVLTMASVANAAETFVGPHHLAWLLGSAIIAAGSLMTCFTRLRAIAHALRAEA